MLFNISIGAALEYALTTTHWYCYFPERDNHRRCFVHLNVLDTKINRSIFSYSSSGYHARKKCYTDNGLLGLLTNIFQYLPNYNWQENLEDSNGYSHLENAENMLFWYAAHATTWPDHVVTSSWSFSPVYSDLEASVFHWLPPPRNQTDPGGSNFFQSPTCPFLKNISLRRTRAGRIMSFAYIFSNVVCSLIISTCRSVRDFPKKPANVRMTPVMSLFMSSYRTKRTWSGFSTLYRHQPW